MINDIRPIVVNWRTGGLCPRCAANQAQWNFDQCLAAFNRITQGDYDGNPNLKRLSIGIAMNDFENKLDAFEQFYQNCG
jgi:hypothetical protein